MKTEIQETIYPDKSPAERLDMMRANCTKSETQSIKVYFDEEQLAEMKSQLSDHSIEKNDREQELAELASGLKAQIKEKQKLLKKLLVLLKNKFQEENQEVFLFDDQDLGLMLTYDKNGELINSRKLLPKERQTSIINLKTGTHS